MKTRQPKFKLETRIFHRAADFKKALERYMDRQPIGISWDDTTASLIEVTIVESEKTLNKYGGVAKAIEQLKAGLMCLIQRWERLDKKD